MARHPHPCVSLTAGKSYVIVSVGEGAPALQFAVSSAVRAAARHRRGKG
jgi:hypothetical protein